jgi:hypothetical protein
MKFKFLNIALTSLVLSATSLVNVANAGLLLDEDFDPITSSDWTISNGSVLGSPSGEFFDGNALHFTGTGTRSAETNEYDVSGGGVLSFMLKIGGPLDTSTFEDADSGEDVAIQYSVANGSWNNLLVIDTEDALYRDTWGLVSLNLSGSALSTNTKFQWVQLAHSNSIYDNWAIDNVQLVDNNGPQSTSVPEPTSLAILALGLLGLTSRKLKK